MMETKIKIKIEKALIFNSLKPFFNNNLKGL